MTGVPQCDPGSSGGGTAWLTDGRLHAGHELQLARARAELDSRPSKKSRSGSNTRGTRPERARAPDLAARPGSLGRVDTRPPETLRRLDDSAGELAAGGRDRFRLPSDNGRINVWSSYRSGFRHASDHGHINPGTGYRMTRVRSLGRVDTRPPRGWEKG